MPKTMRNKQPSKHPQPQASSGEEISLQLREDTYLRAHQGPLPDPATFQHYEEILPGTAERILKMAEENAAHFREMEKKTLDAQIELNKQTHREVSMGQAAGLLAVAMAFAVAAFSVQSAYPAVAVIVGGSTIAALTTAFIAGRTQTSSSPDNEGKNKPSGQQPPPPSHSLRK